MIRRCGIVPMLLLITMLAKAGDSTGVSLSKRVYVGLSFTPGMAYRYLTYNTRSNASEAEKTFNKQFYKERNSQEKPIFGFNAGVRVGIRATKFLVIETGIDYSYKGYNLTRNVTFGSSYNPSLDPDSTKMSILKIKYIYHYLDIPVALNFLIGKQKVKCVISTGAYLNFIVATSTYSSLSVPSEGIKSTARQTTTRDNGHYPICNVSPFLGVGIDYSITNLIALRVMPMAEIQAITNVNSYGYMPERLWSAGINTVLFFGVVKTFKSNHN